MQCSSTSFTEVYDQITPPNIVEYNNAQFYTQ